jgi:hypothetical protein
VPRLASSGRSASLPHRFRTPKRENMCGCDRSGRRRGARRVLRERPPAPRAGPRSVPVEFARAARYGARSLASAWASACTYFLCLGSALYGCSTRVRCGVQPRACGPRRGRDAGSVTRGPVAEFLVFFKYSTGSRPSRRPAPTIGDRPRRLVAPRPFLPSH